MVATILVNWMPFLPCTRQLSSRPGSGRSNLVLREIPARVSPIFKAALVGCTKERLEADKKGRLVMTDFAILLYILICFALLCFSLLECLVGRK